MGNNKYKILVVEDEANIRSFMETILNTNGYHALLAENCVQGESMFRSYNPDLVVLDLGLPDRDGLEFIRFARDSHSGAEMPGSTDVSVPILVLSARTTEQDKISALDYGANDYITKPFGTGELLARVRAALRGMRRGSVSVPGANFTYGDMVIDYDKRLVTVGGVEINLTQTEYNIVALLSEYAGKVMTYASIIRGIWGISDPGSVKKLQVNMANIRKKLGVRPGEQKYILNELGIGYRMAENDLEQCE